MKKVWIIAKFTIFELIRSKILFVLAIFSVLMFGFSFSLGEMSFDEQERIVLNTGLTSSYLVAIVLSLLQGHLLLAKELDKGTYSTILARPLSRTQFMLGKFFGLLALISVVVFMLLIILSALVGRFHIDSYMVFGFIAYGIILEVIVLIALSVFLSLFMQSLVAVSSAFGIFLIGHWVSDLYFFAEKSGDDAYRTFAQIVKWIVPNLEMLNWRSSIHLNYHLIEWNILFGATTHVLGWAFVLLFATMFIFNRKDLI